VDEDRILGRLEDGAVARLRALQRFARAQLLDLGRGTHREDAQHRLDALQVRERLARQDRDRAQRRAGGVVQRHAGIALGACQPGIVQRGKPLAEPVRVGVELAAVYLRARRPVERIRQVALHLAVAVDRQQDQRLRIVVDAARHERRVDVQDRREVTHQFGEDRLAARARDRQRGRAQRLFGATALDLGDDAAGEDLQQRLGQRRVADGLAVHRDQQPSGVPPLSFSGKAAYESMPLAPKIVPGANSAATPRATWRNDRPTTWAQVSLQGVVEVAQRLAVEHGGQRAQFGARLVAEDRDEHRRRPQDLREFLDQLGEQAGPPAWLTARAARTIASATAPGADASAGAATARGARAWGSMGESLGRRARACSPLPARYRADTRRIRLLRRIPSRNAGTAARHRVDTGAPDASAHGPLSGRQEPTMSHLPVPRPPAVAPERLICLHSSGWSGRQWDACRDALARRFDVSTPT